MTDKIDESNVDFYKFELRETLKHYIFDSANLQLTKLQILNEVNRIYDEWVGYGDRFITLLYFALAREGFKKMQYGIKPEEIRDYMEVVEDFKKEWESNPKLHKSKVLAEYL